MLYYKIGVIINKHDWKSDLSEIPETYRFSNGNFIFKNEQIIIPKSSDGQKIEKILKIQKNHKKLNAEQKAFFEQLTKTKNSQMAIELLIKGTIDANTKRPTPIEKYQFSNGNFIFKKDSIIKPTSKEGKIIEQIFKTQEKRKALNNEQKKIKKQLVSFTSSLQTIKYLINCNKNPSFVLDGFHPSIKTMRKMQKKKPIVMKQKRRLSGARIGLFGFKQAPMVPTKKIVALRLNKVKIKNLNSYIRKKSSIFVITAVSDGSTDDPVLISLDSYDNIKEGCKLPMSQILIYYKESEKLPSFIDARILVVKSNKGIRDIGTALTKIKNDSQYKSAVESIVPLLSGGVLAEPLKTSLNFIIQIVGNILKTKKDDKLLFYPFSLVKVFDGYKQSKCDNNEYAEICYEVQSLTE